MPPFNLRTLYPNRDGAPAIGGMDRPLMSCAEITGGETMRVEKLHVFVLPARGIDHTQVPVACLHEPLGQPHVQHGETENFALEYLRYLREFLPIFFRNCIGGEQEAHDPAPQDGGYPILVRCG